MEKNAINILTVVLGLTGLTLEMVYFTHFFGNEWWILSIAATSLIIFPVLYSIFFRTSRNTTLFLILVLSIFVYILYPLYASDFSYLPSRDPSFNFQVVNDILTQHKIPFGQGQELAYAYSYYPFMHVLVASLSIITGFDSVTMLKVSTLFYVATPFVVYLISRRIFSSEKIAQTAAFIFAFTPLYYVAPIGRAFGLFFFGLTLYALFSIKKKAQSTFKSYFLLGAIFCFALSGGHFLSLTVLLLVLLFVGVVGLFLPKITKGKLTGFSPIATMLMLAIGFSWVIFFALPSIFALRGNISSFMQTILGESVMNIGISGSFSGYTGIEQVLMLISFSSMLLLGGIGFISFLRDHNDSPIGSVFILLGSMFVLLQILSNRSPDLNYLSQRVWSYLFVVLAPIAAYAISKSGFRSFKLENRTRRKLIQYILLLLVLSGSGFAFIFSVPRYWYNFNLESETGTLTSLRGYGEKVFSSVKFYVNYSNPHYLALGDAPVRDLGGAFNKSASNIRLGYNLYYNQSQLSLKNVKYVFIDSLLSVYSQSPSWKQTEPKANATYLTYLATNQPSWDKIYDNSLVCIITRVND